MRSGNKMNGIECRLIEIPCGYPHENWLGDAPSVRPPSSSSSHSSPSRLLFSDASTPSGLSPLARTSVLASSALSSLSRPCSHPDPRDRKGRMQPGSEASRRIARINSHLHPPVSQVFNENSFFLLLFLEKEAGLIAAFC